MADNVKKKSTGPCELCNYYVWDEDDECYYCDVDMDEDDYGRLAVSGFKECQYYVPADEYLVVRHQM